MRAFLVVMDSVGIGGAPDADRFFNGDVPDTGSNTVLNIARACAEGHANQGRHGPLNLPTLTRLGLGNAIHAATGEMAPNFHGFRGNMGRSDRKITGQGYALGPLGIGGANRSVGLALFPEINPSFPSDVTDAVCRAAGVSGILGNCHASGTEIIQNWGSSRRNGTADLLHIHRQCVPNRRP